MSESLIAVTGATGHLGRLVVESLLERGVPAGRIVAGVRRPEKASELSARGVQVRAADYTRPETLDAALEGVGRLLLVSSNEVGQRFAQHRNVIEAAKRARVELLAYTSVLKAPTSGLMLAGEHKATEEAVGASGLPSVFLRHSWYTENYDASIAQGVAHGAILGSADGGRVSAASRADYAAAAAAVLTEAGHENKAYELGGDEAFTLAELAAEVSRQSGREVVYRDLSPEAYAEALVSAGVPEPFARVLADSDQGIARGELYTDSGDLRRLAGRPTVTLAEAVAAALPK
jgi:NAD(P)H dehydrogenase (quinone)